MIVPSLTALIGTIAGTLMAVFLLDGNASGLDALLGIVGPSFAGATTGSFLGLFSGITGGMIGGLVAVVFVILPIGWLFTHAVISVLAAKLITAAVLAWAISIIYPH